MSKRWTASLLMGLVLALFGLFLAAGAAITNSSFWAVIATACALAGGGILIVTLSCMTR